MVTKMLLTMLVLMMGMHSQSASASQGQGIIFGFWEVVELAAELARNPYRDTQIISESLTKITYDQWREIRFKPERSLWRNEDLFFEVQLFHVGFLYDRPVGINLVEAGTVQAIPFSTDFFDYGTNDFRNQNPSDLGYAGFRLHYPINSVLRKN